ncbi:MAG: hypothetical protein JWN76_1415, partial [Chitinophagaceae bacterium]|nr:hypothetical protein [Chitinophagaceae bacterium]
KNISNQCNDLVQWVLIIQKLNYMKQLLLLILLPVFTACEKQTGINGDPSLIDCSANPSAILKYSGEFERITISGSKTSNVQFVFTGNNFSGTSSLNHFPAIAEGQFALLSDSINFTNKSVWTADFDGTLILNGKWKWVQKATVFSSHASAVLISRNTIG